MLQFTCADMGFDCDVRMTGNTEEEIREVLIKHAKEAHGLEADDFTPELTRTIKSHIHRT